MNSLFCARGPRLDLLGLTVLLLSLTSAVGRFISEDPIGFRGGDINHYGYVWQSPLGYRDRSGRTVGATILPTILIQRSRDYAVACNPTRIRFIGTLLLITPPTLGAGSRIISEWVVE